MTGTPPLDTPLAGAYPHGAASGCRPPDMNASEFTAKWSRVQLTERSAAQQHFLDLCELVDHPKPATLDPTGETFTFEKGASKTGGGEGWADVWKQGFFAWEYKGKHKDLDAAHRQLLGYREALENPPLLVVSDMDRIIVRTNFTNTPLKTHEVCLDGLGEPGSLDVLRAVFHDPGRLKPGKTRVAITKEAADRFASLALTIGGRRTEPQRVAQFLDRLVFCLFAEDVGLLPRGLFSRLVGQTSADPERFSKYLGQLFEAMAHGSDFLMEDIRHFNGNLFSDSDVVPLKAGEIGLVEAAARMDWDAVDPSIFGTLFERGLDPGKRSQLGAHYTSREDIETLVEPVITQPLRWEWDEARCVAANLLAHGGKQDAPPHEMAAAETEKARAEAEAIVRRFQRRLASVTVLDPACGSGNFLYVSLQKLMELESQVLEFARIHGLPGFMQQVGPWQLYGIEISLYAWDLAQMTVWIGYLQWRREQGDPITESPVLKRNDNFLLMDAILDLTDPENPKEPEWPAVDFIVGNPPFLGGKLLRRELGDAYVDGLQGFWRSRVKPESDLCCYWFEKARAHIEQGKCRRAGLLATQGIRGGANREVLKRIKETGDIFFAESDRPWVLDGANVHVSMVGFDGGAETARSLDGGSVSVINTDLTATAAVAEAVRLAENRELGFMGTTKQGAFDIAGDVAFGWLPLPNPNGKPNSDVVVPWVNGLDVTRRPRNMWVVDFFNLGESDASQYEAPFAQVDRTVRVFREENPRSWYRAEWWQHYAQRPALRKACAPLPRFLATPRVTKHRLFVWLAAPTVPDCQLIVFARSDDYFFGVLHSRVHEVWARAQGTQLRERESGFRYTPTTCFETFPFPRPTPVQEAAIAEAAKELDSLRNNWLNPPEWTQEEILEFPGSADGPWARYVHESDERGIGTVRWPRIVPRPGGYDTMLRKRTLTNLYNERPTWLRLSHEKLDAVVFTAYGWDPGISDDDLLAKLLDLNLSRAAEEAGS